MGSRPMLRTRLSLFASAIILLMCSSAGMFVGAAAQTLSHRQGANGSPGGLVVSGTPPGQPLPSETPALGATATSTVSTSATGFSLSIALSSRTLSAGETFTVTVTATTAAGTPASGLSCVLRAPTDGPPGLFATWPAPVTTDASGHAAWTLTAPLVAPGLYGIEADAVGAHRYEFHRYVTLQIS
jgi:hypothetical protein